MKSSRRGRMGCYSMANLIDSLERAPGSPFRAAKRRHSCGRRQPLAPARAAPGRSSNCSASVKARVRINSVLTSDVKPDAARIMARTTNWIDGRVDGPGAGQQHAGHQPGNPDDAQRAQGIDGGDEAGLERGLDVVADASTGIGAQRLCRFDLAHVREHVRAEPVERQANLNRRHPKALMKDVRGLAICQRAGSGGVDSEPS